MPQPGLFQPRREQILLRHAPQHLAVQPGGDAGHKAGCCGPIHRAVAASCNLVQGTEQQPAAGQSEIELRDVERQHFRLPRATALQPRDTLA